VPACLRGLAGRAGLPATVPFVPARLAGIARQTGLARQTDCPPGADPGAAGRLCIAGGLRAASVNRAARLQAGKPDGHVRIRHTEFILR